MDLSIRRAKIASKDLYKAALKKPPQLKVTPRKNVSKDELGNLHGRVHVGKQDINQLQTRKVKALRKTAEEKAEARSAKRRKVAAAVEEVDEADDINDDGAGGSDSNDE
jgi:ribosome production factor 2